MKQLTKKEMLEYLAEFCAFDITWFRATTTERELWNSIKHGLEHMHESARIGYAAEEMYRLLRQKLNNKDNQRE